MTVEGYDPQMFLLSVASYVGTGIELPNLDKDVHEAIEGKLGEWGLSDWEIVWGPGIAVLPSKIKEQPRQYPSDIMFVARNGSSYFISVSPTNFRSAFDITEDFRVHVMRRWPYAPQRPGLAPRISEGFHEALNILQFMKPARGLPGHGQTLDEFLRGEDKVKKDVRIITGGHSQGGATAPLVALWLLDTKDAWDAGHDVSPAAFSCYRSAGPTPGESAFADYYDKRLPNTKSLVNNLDFVTKMFVQSEMPTIPYMYEGIPATEEITTLVTLMERMAGEHEYTQIGRSHTFEFGTTPELSIYEGKDVGKCQKFAWQMGYQHVQAYFEYFADYLEAHGISETFGYEQFADICG